MSTKNEFEPTTIEDLLWESIDSKAKIRIFSSSIQEWGILSVYMEDGEIYLDIEEM